MRSIVISLVIAAVVWGLGLLVSWDVENLPAAWTAPGGPLENDWRDATVLKICHGSTIYRLANGRIVTGQGYHVENPETVCEAP